MQSRVHLVLIFSGCTPGWDIALTKNYLRPDGELSFPMGNVTAVIVRDALDGEVQVGSSESLLPMPR